MGGHDTRELHGAAAVESIAMDGQSIGSKAAAAVTHNSNSQWAIPVNKNTPLWRNVDCVRGGLSRPEYLSQGVIYMIDNNYVWGGGGGKEEEIY